MAKKRDTGESTDYDARDEGIIESVIDRAFQQFEGPSPTRVRVTAQIEWSGVVDAGNNGVRTTTLDGLDLSGVRESLDLAREAAEKASSTAPVASYTAKGWHAQIRELTESARGSEAADRAGLNVTDRTLLGWLSETGHPSKQNEQKIAQAYDELRNWHVRNAEAVHESARHEIAEKLSEAIRNRYGSDVRLRDIERFDLS